MSKRKSSRKQKKTRKPQTQADGALHVRSQQAFERYLDDPQPVVVDFWATWCGPCRAMAPTFDRVAKAFDGKAHFLKVNTEELPELAGVFGIRSIPTLLVLVGDEVINSHVGLTDEATLTRMAHKAVEKSQGVTWATKLKRLFSKEQSSESESAAS
jgi:thioredoxin 1